MPSMRFDPADPWRPLAEDGRPTPLGRAVLALPDDELARAVAQAPPDSHGSPTSDGPAGFLVRFLFDHAPRRLSTLVAGPEGPTVLRRRSAVAVLLDRDPSQYASVLAEFVADDAAPAGDRLRVASLLATADPETHGPSLVDLALQHPPTEVDTVDLVARWCCRHGGPGTVPLLAQLLGSHPDEWGRLGGSVEAAVRRLGRYALPLVEPALTGLESRPPWELPSRLLPLLPLAEADPAVRERMSAALRGSLEGMGGGFWVLLSADLCDGGPGILPLLEVLFEHAQTLGGFDPVRIALNAAERLGVAALPLLRRVARTAKPDWTVTAATHLIALGDDADREIGEGILSAALDRGEPLVLPHICALLRGPLARRFADPLADLAGHSDPAVRRAAAAALATLGESAVEAAERHRAGDANQRVAGAELLATVGTPTARTRLEEWLATEKDAAVVAEMLLRLEPLQEMAGVRIGRTELEARAKRCGKACKVPAWVGKADLPKLAWADGSSVDAPTLRYLLQRPPEPGHTPTHARLRAARDLLDEESRVAFARAWLLASPASPKRLDGWVLAVPGILGGATVVSALAELVARASTLRTAVEASLTALALTDAPTAVAPLMPLEHAWRGSHPERARHAGACLAALAARVGEPADDLFDRHAPDLGFGADGRLDLGHGYIATLTSDLRPRFTVAGGRPAAELPKDAPGAVRAAAKSVVEEVEAARDLHRSRLEQALVARRRWPATLWHATFARPHPLLTPLAARLVWCHTTAGVRSYFRPRPDGTPEDARREPVRLPSEGVVCLAHPAEMTADERSAWASALTDPPFPQLARPVFRVGEHEPLADVPRQAQAVVRLLRGRGWEAHDADAAGRPSSLTREFVGEGVTATVAVACLPRYGGGEPIRLGRPTFARVGVALPDSEVPAAVYSEVVDALRALPEAAW